MALLVSGIFLLLGLLKGGCTASCHPEVAANILWSVEGVAAFPCNDVHPSLQGGLIRRTCGSDGVWSDVDFSSCTLPHGSTAFVLLWIPLSTTEVLVRNNAKNILNDVSTRLLLGDLSGEASPSITLTLASTKAISLTSLSILLLVDLPQVSTPDSFLTQTLESSLDSLSQNLTIGGVELLSGKGKNELGYEGFHLMSSCSCRPKDSLFEGYCAGSLPVPPCKCSSDICQCHTPEFVGDGDQCTRDVDQDKFPKEPLSSCPNFSLTISNSSQPRYCIQDNCPLLHNPDQDVTACKALRSFVGCRSVHGTRLDIVWANTRLGETDRQLCPLAQGFATRRCYSSGQWSKNEDVTMCMSYAFGSTFSTADGIFRLGRSKSLSRRLSMVAPVVKSLASLTQGNSFSLLPTDLNSTNLMIDGVLSLLEDTLTSSENISAVAFILNKMDEICADIFSNILEVGNLDGWLELTQIGDGTPKLLDNIERFTLYLSQNVKDTRRVVKRNNLVVSYLRKPLASTSAVVFPNSVDDLVGSLNLDYIPAQVQLPAKLFEQRIEGSRQSVPSSTFIVRNMELAMPRKMESGKNAAAIASMILSAQVSGRGTALPQPADDPVKLMFQFDPVKNASSYRCAYWKFSDPIGNGFWAFDGIEMTSMETKEEMIIVNCSATHLTSFAILVDVSGALSDAMLEPSSGIMMKLELKCRENPTELKALKYVSYIGCTITIFFLVITIIYFLAQGRELFVKVHYFIHLNLATSLCLAYTLFVAGGATAIAIKEACTSVAVLLHYFLLSAFCWMLCEGLMLYLLVVVVFSRFSRRIWFFLLIGYALPILPVMVSLGIRYEDYGVTDQDGNITFCWLSTKNELTWAFVGPLLAIVLINSVFLSMVLYKVYKSRQSKRQSMTLQKKFSRGELPTAKVTSKDTMMTNIYLFKTLLGAVVVLQPMLGLTWVLGLFSLNRETTVFAWLFTIINSLQGLFIFLFQVVISDKVWKSPRLVRFRSQVSTYKLRYHGSVSTTSTSGACSTNLTSDTLIKSSNKHSLILGCHNNNSRTAELTERLETLKENGLQHVNDKQHGSQQVNDMQHGSQNVVNDKPE